MKQFPRVSWPFGRRGQAGQAHTEYGLILFLIGITVIGALTLLGQQVHGMWHTISASWPR